ncbi:MAG: SEL1-like repeat protein [Desulfohalobiaceae bacterium]|nr:SEL1-like repeat protein [Desulfohalobiaceae bacterium]
MRTLAVLITALFLLVPVAGSADYSDGLHAYLQGHYEQAYKEFKALASEGDPQAQYILGSMYATGKGVLQNYVKAHAWFNIAASRGHDKAAAYREKISGKMTSEQTAKAQQLASEWSSGDTAEKKAKAPPEEKAKSRKEMITSIQKHLEELGYYEGSIDGLMGPNTSSSIREYQQEQDLQVSGNPSQALLQHLQKTVAEKPVTELPAAIPTGPWTKVLLHDAFSDGDYTSNPSWTRVSGDFHVDENHYLRSARQIPEAQQTSKKDGGQQSAVQVLGKVVKEVMDQQQGSRESAKFSEIYTQQDLGRAFALRIELKLVTDKPGQAFEVGVFTGQNRDSGYLLRYSQQDQQSLALIRYKPSGSSVIDVARQKGLLSGRTVRAITWLRYKDGTMKVLVDDEPVLSSKDRMYDAFRGVRFLNHGGEYAVAGISVFGPAGS